MSESGEVTYYLPPGSWTDLTTGERREGGRYVSEASTSFFRIPLWVRPGTLLALGPHDAGFDHDATQAVDLRVFELGDGESTTAKVFSPDGQRQVTFQARREGSEVLVSVIAGQPPAGARYRLLGSEPAELQVRAGHDAIQVVLVEPEAPDAAGKSIADHRSDP